MIITLMNFILCLNRDGRLKGREGGKGRSERQIKRMFNSCRAFGGSILHGVVVMHIHHNSQWLPHHNGGPHNHIANLTSHATKRCNVGQRDLHKDTKPF